MRKAYPRRAQDSVWTGLAGVVLLFSMVAGGLRVYGVMVSRQVFLDGGLTRAGLNLLVGLGVFQALISLVGLAGMRTGTVTGKILPWVAVILNILAYWIERLGLWAKDQRGGNVVFMIGAHLLWVALMVAFTIKPTMKEEHGQGN